MNGTWSKKYTSQIFWPTGWYSRWLHSSYCQWRVETRYRRIVQWGGKDGQPLYAHVVDLVFTFVRLTDLLDLSQAEQRVMMLALSAHDINKVPGENKPMRFPDQASAPYVGMELKRLGADEFFPGGRIILKASVHWLGPMAVTFIMAAIYWLSNQPRMNVLRWVEIGSTTRAHQVDEGIGYIGFVAYAERTTA